MIHSLQVYRGFAALLVVFVHAGHNLNSYFINTAFAEYFSFGISGVAFFFVLSGFIIYEIHQKDIGHPKAASKYLFKRITRIYPAYWVVTLLLLPAWLYIPSMGESYHREVIPLLKSLFLFPQDHHPHLGVGWTLVHEMLFYTSFLILIVLGKIGQLFYVFWFSVCFYLFAVGYELEYPAVFFLGVHKLLFFMGIAACLLAENLRAHSRACLIVFFTGNAFFITVGLCEDIIGKGSQLAFLYGAASFLIIVSCKNESIDYFFSNRPLLKLLGNASYSIYLIHTPVLSVLSRILPKIYIVQTEFQSNMVYLLMISIAVITGILFYWLIEKPLILYFNKISRLSHSKSTLENTK